MKASVLYAFLFCSFASGFIGWRVYVLQNRKVPNFGIVEDLSLSHSGACESMLGLAEQVFRTNDVEPGSTLSVLVIGDRATANEPWQLGSYAIPRDRKVLEGRSASVRRQRDMLHDFWSKCRSARRTTISPIFIAVKQALADLRAAGCGDASRCRLLVDSDLEETVEPSIESRLRAAVSTRRVLPPALSNEGIEVVLCGLAVTTGRITDSSGKEYSRSVGHGDRLRQVWLSLFTEPGRVAFQPYCPKPSDLASYMTPSPSATENQ